MASMGKQSEVAIARPIVLVGRFEHALDPKKRLTVPACWREQMGSYVYVFPNPHEKCLSLIPPAEMEARMERLRQKALFDKQANAVLRVLGENAEQCSIDTQGRIRIRDRLLAYAGLTDQVVMKGATRMAELWPASKDKEVETVDQAALAAACAAVDF
jgi:MraZ protein